MSTTWKSRLGKLERLIKGSAKNAFEIATELRELWKDPAFLAEACNGKIDDMDDKLERFASATPCHLNELLQMLEHFPNQADWKDGHILHLRDEAAKATLKRGKSADSEGKPRQRRVSLAEYEAIQRERDELAKEKRQLTAEIKRLREENLLLIKKLPGGKAACAR